MEKNNGVVSEQDGVLSEEEMLTKGVTKRFEEIDFHINPWESIKGAIKDLFKRSGGNKKKRKEQKGTK